MYYHSFAYEIVTIVFFILGSFNFGLHYAIWQGKKRELMKNIETQSFFITSFIACVLAVTALAKTGIYAQCDFSLQAHCLQYFVGSYHQPA